MLISDTVAGMRINKYLADKGYATRKGADTLIEKGLVYINGARAVLGQQVEDTDQIEVRVKNPRKYRYLAYHKPRGIKTEDIITHIDTLNVFPIGRLDKMSRGLIILTDDGRVTERLLSPTRTHEKEYKVRVREAVPNNLKRRMESGVVLEDGYKTREAKVTPTGEHTFAITLTEGKKHQIRRMCETLRLTVVDLERVRIMNIRLGHLASGATRAIEGAELETFLKLLGLIE